jgi:ribosomal RNA-processing protein 12
VTHATRRGRQGGGKAGGKAGSERGSSLRGVIGAVEALLQGRYKATWHCTLPVAQSLFNRLRADSLPLLHGALKQLVVIILRVKNLPPKAHEALDAALGAAIVAIGPARLLEAVPLFADPAAPSLATPNNTWLLPALKRHVRGAQLDYFTQTLLPHADRLREAAVAAEAAGRPVEAKNLMVLHEQVHSATSSRAAPQRPGQTSGQGRSTLRVVRWRAAVLRSRAGR